AFYIHDRLSGIARRPLTPEEAEDPIASPGGGQDRKAFPEFYAEYDQATGLAGRLGFRVVCTGKLAYTGHAQLKRDIANLKEAAAKAKAVGAFLPVVAPASALPGAKFDDVYKSERDFLFGLAEALREEYKAIVDAGLFVQIDDAFLPYMYEKLVPPMSLADYRKWAEMRIDALNHALEGIPPEQARYHSCCGSWHGPHVHDVPLKDIVHLVRKVNDAA